MSNLDYLNLSTDLRRISLWLQSGQEALADQFIAISLRKFGGDHKIISKRSINDWLKRIAEYKKRGWKSAEDALTFSVILKNRFGLQGSTL